MKAVIEDKIPISHLITKPTFKRFENSFMHLGRSYLEVNGVINFSKDIHELMDEKTKNIILSNAKDLNLKTKMNKQELNLKEKEKLDKELQKFRNKCLNISIILLNLISEVSLENKDRAELIYKAFKEYFVLVESYNIAQLDRSYKKVDFFKELCKIIIAQKEETIENFEIINDVLYAQAITEKNLNSHKELIKKLLKVIQEKNEEIYLKTSEIEIFEKEIRFWVYDYDYLKHDKIIRVNIFIFNILFYINRKIRKS